MESVCKKNAENVCEVVLQILKKENILFSKINKSSSGFTNDVFLVDKSYVIKLTKDENKKDSLKKETNIYKSLSFNFIPQLIASGEFDGWTYLIISQINGESLYSIWHKLDDIKRRDIVKQMANILMKIHQSKVTKLPQKDIFDDWKSHWKAQIDDIINCLEKLRINNTKAINKLKNTLQFLDKNEYSLVYNDAHFDNFIYDKGKLFLIDFDRVLFCPIDYELMIIKSMCDQPWKFANEEDEKNVKKEDYQNVLGWLEEFYPKLFDIPFLKERIELYQFAYYFEQAYKKMDRTWLKDLLNDFAK